MVVFSLRVADKLYTIVLVSCRDTANSWDIFGSTAPYVLNRRVIGARVAGLIVIVNKEETQLKTEKKL